MTAREGVDVASFQGTPGQWRGAAGDIGFAAVKLTELSPDGTRYVNPDAAADWEWLKANGKKRIAYLFAHPGADAADTASFFTGQLRKLGLREDDMVAVDLEVNDGKSPAEVSAWAREVTGWLRHDLGRRPLLYTDISFSEAGNCTGLPEHCSLWIADPSSPMGHPRVPAPWASWAIHQFSQQGAIDRDFTAWDTPEHMAEHLGHEGRILESLHPEPVVPRHRVRKAAAGVRHRAKRTVTAARTAVRGEPVMTAGGTAGMLAAGTALLQHHAGLHLDTAQLNAVITALVALAGVASTIRTRPVRVGVMSTALSTAATAAATFGVHLPPAVVGGEMPVAALIAVLLVRSHVSPRTRPAASPPPSRSVSDAVVRFTADTGGFTAGLDEMVARARQAAADLERLLPGGVHVAAAGPAPATPETAGGPPVG